MNKNENRHYILWGITATITLCLAITFAYILFNGVHFMGFIKKILAIFMPIIYGFVIAYLLAPILNYIEDTICVPVYRKLLHINSDTELNIKQKRIVRAHSLILTIVSVVVVFYAFFRLLIPQLISSIENIVINLPLYVNNLSIQVMDLFDQNPEIEATANAIYSNYSEQAYKLITDNVLPGIQATVKNISTSILGSLINVIIVAWNMIIGIIISIYLVSSKEKFAGQAKKICFSIFDIDYANILISNVRFIHTTFIGFVGGKIIDSFIIGILCYICISFIGTPYPLLISVIIGVTNIIPFFGPYLGAIPSALLILMVDPKQCLYFIIFILILQQIDGNIIGPKILGDSTGLSSFWVIFAITVFGGLFGFVGMIVGVPLLAVIFAAIKSLIDKRLTEKNLSVDSNYYINVDSIENSVVNKSVDRSQNSKKNYRKKNNYYKKNSDNRTTWKNYNKKKNSPAETTDTSINSDNKQ